VTAATSKSGIQLGRLLKKDFGPRDLPCVKARSPTLRPWQLTGERDASQKPNRRPRTSCVHPPFQSPRLARSRRDVRHSLYWRSVLALEGADSPRGIHRGRPSGHRCPQVFETPGVLGRSRRVGSVQDYRDRKLGARLEALCFVTLDVVLQAARNSLPTAAATIKGFEVMRMIRKGRCPMLEPGPMGRDALCEPAFPSCRLIGRNRRRTLRRSAASVTQPRDKRLPRHAGRRI
jgi:hypothetical protein